MFPDHTLTPRETVRLCALGVLAEAPMRYSAVAHAVRHFTSHVVGPSLEMMGLPVELLLYEGLVEAREGTGMEDDALLALTADGRAEFERLITARLRAGSDLNRLVMALKFRFLHLLPAAEQDRQIDVLEETWQTERDRLRALHAQHADDPGHLATWLEHEIGVAEERLRWLETLRGRLSGAA